MPLGRFKTKVRALREKQILSITEEMLATPGGCRDFSTEELARRVGVGKGTIYSHYASQRKLLDATFSRVTERLLLRIGAEQEGDVQDLLRRTVFQIVDEIATSSGGSLGYPCCLQSSPCPHGGCGKIGATLLVLIERGAKTGAVRQDIDASLAVGFLHHLLSAARNYDARREELHANLLKAAQFWLRGIESKNGIVPISSSD